MNVRSSQTDDTSPSGDTNHASNNGDIMAWTEARDLPYEEKILWVAVMRRAVFDYVLYKGVRSHKLEWQRAYQYIFSVGLRHNEGLSLEEVCSLFGWDPDYVRRLTKKLTRADIKKIEFGAYRHDLTLRDLISMAAERRSILEVSGSAAPVFPALNYPTELRERIEPQDVSWSDEFEVHIPLVKWDSAAV